MANQHFKELLNSRDLKATTNRLNLLSCMEGYGSAIPFTQVQEAMKAMDRVTLYRTIESLLSQGIIHKAYQEGNEVYYAICGNGCSKSDHQHDHIHFKCKTCSAVTCEEINGVVDLNLKDYEVHSLSIHVEGVCKFCQKSKKN